MGTRVALTTIALIMLVVAAGCGSSEPLPDLPEQDEPLPAPVVDTRPKSVPLGESTRQMRSTAGRVHSKVVEFAKLVPIAQAIQHFQANNGRLPKSNEEFHQRVMGDMKIPYPELDEGYELVFDPEAYDNESFGLSQQLVEQEAAPEEAATEETSPEEPTSETAESEEPAESNP